MQMGVASSLKAYLTEVANVFTVLSSVFLWTSSDKANQYIVTMEL